MEQGLVTFSIDESLLRHLQEERLKRNPKKIPFLPNFNIADDDKATFKRYERYGERVIDSCIHEICERNFIDPDLVSRKLFIKVANELGFYDESNREYK